MDFSLFKRDKTSVSGARPWLPGGVGSVFWVLGVWLVSLTPFLTPWDDLLYDALVRVLPGKNTSVHEVVLLETPPDKQSVDPALIRTVLAAGARHLVSLQAVDSVSGLSELLHEFPGRLTIARLLPRDAASEDVVSLAAFETPAGLPDSRSGMFRQQWARVQIGGKTLPGLRAAGG